MNIIEAIILGAIQGLTEFIPISSSGHLVIAQFFMNGASDHLFIEWINLGTVLALIIFFRKRILDLIQRVIVKRDYRLALNIIIAMIPAGLAGFFLAGFIESNPFFGSIWTVVVTLTIVGILLIVLEKLPRLSNVDENTLSKKRALSIGLAQVLALIPGTSRSGSTIITGRLMGLSRASAAEFSFLVSIPIMLGVIAKLLIKSADRTYLINNFTTLLIGNVVAFMCGMIAIGFLMRFLEKKNLTVFGWYRVGLAIIIAAIVLVK